MKRSSGINIRISPYCLVSVVALAALWNFWGFSIFYPEHNFVPTKLQLWRQASISPQEWTIEDVDVWLAIKVLLDSRHRAAFRSKKIDGKLLLGLTENDIRRELHIDDNLSVKRIIIHVEDLKQGNSNGKGFAPSITGQLLLRNAHFGNSSDFSMRVDSSNTKPRVLHLYRCRLETSARPLPSRASFAALLPYPLL